MIFFYKNLKGEQSMNDLQNLIKMYLNYCETQKRLDVKTVKSYRIDLRQFSQYFSASIQAITPDTLESYIATLHQTTKNSKKKSCFRESFFSLFGI